MGRLLIKNQIAAPRHEDTCVTRHTRKGRVHEVLLNSHRAEKSIAFLRNLNVIENFHH